MCCGVPLDMYDVVVLGGGPMAFATAFAVREAGRTVALVLAERRLDEWLAAAMARFEITLIAGWPHREDEHYLDVEGRLVYGERVVSTLPTPGEHAAGWPVLTEAVTALDTAIAAALDGAATDQAAGMRPG